VALIANHLRAQGTTHLEIAEDLQIEYFDFENSILETSSDAFADKGKF